jgi:uncharacterized membrane protein
MYLWLKLLHVASVVIFLGNIITGLFWHSHAARTRDRSLVAHAMSGIIRSDALFTLPGVFLIIATGLATAVIGKLPIVRTPWIMWSLVLFAISGVIFMARVAPLQRQLKQLAERGGEDALFDWKHYDALARRWELWGALALITPLAAMALMILKPVF